MTTYLTSYFGPDGKVGESLTEHENDDTAIDAVSSFMDHAGDVTLAVIDERTPDLYFRPVATIRDTVVAPALTAEWASHV